MTPLKHAIALTGSIATGKSTAAALLKLHGYRIIDADSISHQVLIDLADRVTAELGTADRGELGMLVFEHPKKRKVLEGILHPEIRRRILAECEKLETLGVPYFVDIPLFFESGEAYPIDKTAVVYATETMQIERLIKSRHLTDEAARSRIAAQWPIEEKKSRATWVIDNTGDIRHLTAQIDAFVRSLREMD